MIATLRSTEPLAIVDLRADGPVRIGAPTGVAHDANHTAARALSAATRAGVLGADGFVYHSRFTGEACVAVFSRALGKVHALSVEPPIRSADFLDALEDYDITLMTPS